MKRTPVPKAIQALKTCQGPKILLTLFLSFLLLPLLLSNACKTTVSPPDPLQNLQDASKALNDISIAANAAAKTILIVMPDNTSERQQILNIIGKVAEADNRGVAIVRQLTQLSPTDAQSLSVILAPVFAQFHAAVDSGLLGFKDPAVKAKVGVYIDTISTSITIIENILKARTANGRSYDFSPDRLGWAAQYADHSFVCA